ncbi:MAG TPA: carbohydrate binding domain-containing protein [Actinomycetota bacterium]|nr:carbohydrate binding domain-containing protein [Actinomycetota bacterium]
MSPQAKSRSPLRRVTVRVLAAAAALAILASPAIADLPSTQSPALSLVRTIQTRPFVGTSTFARDAEGTAWVQSDNSLWLVGDNGRSAYEVNPYTGVLKRVIDRTAFEAAPRFGGGALAGPDRSGDLESLAYDENSDTLYAFSGTCCTTSALPTAFRLTRVGGQLEVDSFQPLPSTADYTAAAWSPTDDTIYVGKGRNLRTYDYPTNTSGPTFAIKGLSGYLGMDFSLDGNDLMVVNNNQRLYRVRWSTKRLVNGWNLDLTPFGIKDSRGVEVVPAPGGGFDQLYVYDGYDLRSSNDPLKYAVYVFDVSGPTGGELVGNPGFESNANGWTAGGVATLSRVAGGHGGSFSARLSNDGATSGNCLLNDSPNWVDTTTSGPYTASLWVRGDSAGASLRLRLREYNGGTLVGTAQISSITLSTDWQQFSVSLTPQSPGLTTLDLNAYVSSAPPGVCFYADDASIIAA